MDAVIHYFSAMNKTKLISLFVKIVFTAWLWFILSSCQINYYMKSAYNQFSLLNQRKPLEKAATDPRLSEEEKRKIKLAQDVREFTHSHLKLKIKDNYTSYVKLDRSHVTYVVNASPKWELKNYNWDYFWVGEMPYKGFFNIEEAREEAEILKKKDLDVFLRGVSAYSTLGWFNDPILSSMLTYEDWDLVDTIIHETIHANIYIKNSAEFNEQLAMFLGKKGMELYYKHLEGEESLTLKKAANEEKDELIFRNFLHQEVQNIKSFYTNIPQDKRSEEVRQEYFNGIQSRYEKNIRPQLSQRNFDGAFKKQFNNAYLMLYMTYNEGQDDFEKLWTKVGNQFDSFLNSIKSLEKSKNPREDLKKLL